jgi:hypothetical protein
MSQNNNPGTTPWAGFGSSSPLSSFDLSSSIFALDLSDSILSTRLTPMSAPVTSNTTPSSFSTSTSSPQENKAKRAKQETKSETSAVNTAPVIFWKPPRVKEMDENPGELLTESFQSLSSGSQSAIQRKEAIDSATAHELYRSRTEHVNELKGLNRLRLLLSVYNNDRDALLKSEKDLPSAHLQLLGKMLSARELDLHIELTQQQLADTEKLIGHLQTVRQRYASPRARPYMRAKQMAMELVSTTAWDGPELVELTLGLGLVQSEEEEVEYGYLQLTPLVRQMASNWDPYDINMDDLDEVERETVAKTIFDGVVDDLIKRKAQLKKRYIVAKDDRIKGILYDLSPVIDEMEVYNAPPFTALDRDVLDMVLERPESLNKFIHLFFSYDDGRGTSPAALAFHTLQMFSEQRDQFSEKGPNVSDATLIADAMKSCIERSNARDYVIGRMRHAVWYEKLRRLKKSLEDEPHRQPFLMRRFIDELENYFSAEERNMMVRNELFRQDIRQTQAHFDLFRKLFCHPIVKPLEEFAEHFYSRYLASCRQVYFEGERMNYTAIGVHYLTGIVPPDDDESERDMGFECLQGRLLTPMSCDIALTLASSEYWRQHVWFCCKSKYWRNSDGSNKPQLEIDLYERRFVRYLYWMYLYATDPNKLYQPVYEDNKTMFTLSRPSFSTPFLNTVNGMRILEVDQPEAESLDANFAKWFSGQIDNAKRINRAAGDESKYGKYDIELALKRIATRHTETKLVKLRAALGSGRLEVKSSKIVPGKSRTIQLPMSLHAGVAPTILSYISGKPRPRS